MPRAKEGKKKELEPVTRDYTINLHKKLHNIQFKKRAPRAIREIQRFAQAEMFTKVRADHILEGRAHRHCLKQIHLEQGNQERASQGQDSSEQEEERRRGRQGEVLLRDSAPPGRLLQQPQDRERVLSFILCKLLL